MHVLFNFLLISEGSEHLDFVVLVEALVAGELLHGGDVIPADVGLLFTVGGLGCLTGIVLHNLAGVSFNFSTRLHLFYYY